MAGRQGTLEDLGRRIPKACCARHERRRGAPILARPVRVLITGHTGFKGAWLSELAAAAWAPR